MFYDQAVVKLKAGDGGNGLVSFFHTKRVAKGGPDGGDGGNGGSVYFETDDNINTLSDYIRKKKFIAGNGEGGGSRKKHGKNGEDLILRVPLGTIVFSVSRNGDERFVTDLNKKNEKIIIAKGGRGGFGNAHFTSSSRQTPRFAEFGSPGEEIEIKLELRLVADVGLVGFPSCGKSTLLSRVTSAKPKIAEYPFTTIVPNLGVIRRKNSSLVIADIPGLIEGASQGKGLGHEFLRHIKRTRLIVHMIDALSDDWVRDYLDIRHEMGEFDKSLLERKELVAVNKIDVMDEGDLKYQISNFKSKTKLKKVYPISAVTGKGTDELFNDVFRLIQKIPVPEINLKEEKIFTYKDVDENLFEIKKVKSGFRVYCKKIDKLAQRTDFNNWEAVERLRDVMKKLGIIKEMKKQGINSGDLIWIGEKVIEY